MLAAFSTQCESDYCVGVRSFAGNVAVWESALYFQDVVND